MENKKMNKKYILLIAFCAFTLYATAQKQLEILHTNDTHSCVLPTNNNLPDTTLAGRGGFIRRVEMIKEERKKNPDLLLFDSGDFSQGSMYYTLFKGDVEVGLMNMMGYDAATIGNHEFDSGINNLARILKMANFPIICSNYDMSGTPLDGLVKPYLIIKRNGVKIGVFALTLDVYGMVAKENYEAVKYLDPIKTANDMVSLLKGKEKCDLVICLSHLGWGGKGMSDQKVIANTRGIDLVLGGHSHSFFKTIEYVKDLDGKEVAVDQNGKNAALIGEIIINLDKTTRNKK